MRYFNTEGCCRPDLHYMVRLDDRLEQIKKQYIDRGKYFIINRGRQYGKTTTLLALEDYLRADYLVLALDFQLIGSEEFADTASFVHAFSSLVVHACKKMDFGNNQKLAELIHELAADARDKTMRELFFLLSGICESADKPVVLMIDEVDSAANNQVFIDFLAQLRGYYLHRQNNPVFYSVILAGVYDIKNLKLKIRPDAQRQYNSPWNIAAKFQVDMSFSPRQIAVMLEEYKADSGHDLDTESAAREIYGYTSGYPYLVSAICKYMDEEVPGRPGFEADTNLWSGQGIAEAVRMILNENMPLFNSLVRQLDLYQDLRRMIEQVLYQGTIVPFSPVEKSMQLGMMFGFLKEKCGHVVIANRMFEMYLLNLFLAEESLKSSIYRYGERDRNQFVKNGRLNMRLVLEKFVIHFTDIYGGNEEKFLEENGRRFFLLYLKPIINGTGNYYLEAQTRDARRTDVIVDYGGEQFIVELKIWHGNEYHERGEKPLIEYLDDYHLDTGYLLSFNFNKKKEIGVKELRVRGKRIVEAVV